jgi:hypothetical protein
MRIKASEAVAILIILAILAMVIMPRFVGVSCS